MTNVSRVLVAIASVLLLGLLVTPLWSIRLVAPQYPEGLGMRIHAHSIEGAKDHDIENINGLNHYIGMKRIEPAAIPELRYMPWIVVALGIAGFITSGMGKRRLLYAWLGAFAILGALGLYDFWWWTYDYGHNLDIEHAIIIVPGMTYQPPLIGSKQLLNFTATSWPALGGWLAAIAFALSVYAVFLSARSRRTTPAV
jgi:copper chaperone NosL